MLRGREDRYRKFQLHDLDMFKEVKTKVKKVEFASNKHQHHLHSPEIWPHMEWLTLSSALPSAIHVRACLLSHFSCVHLVFTLWTAAHQASPSMGFSRQECWSGVPLPSPPLTAMFFQIFFPSLCLIRLTASFSAQKFLIFNEV